MLRKSNINRWWWMALLVLTALGLESRAKADDRSFVTFGPRASYYTPKDGDGVWMGGAQLRLFPFEALALEGSIDYRRETLGKIKTDVTPVQASLLGYIIPGSPVSLFVLGGAGWYYTRITPPSPSEEQTHNRFGLHAGAGVEWKLSKYWSLDGTYRYIWLEKFSSVNEELHDKEFSDNGHQITIGLNYLF